MILKVVFLLMIFFLNTSSVYAGGGSSYQVSVESLDQESQMVTEISEAKILNNVSSVDDSRSNIFVYYLLIILVIGTILSGRRRKP